MSYRGFLAELLLAECDDRACRRSERRITAAKFPARSPYAASTSGQPQHRSCGRPHPGQVRVGQEGPAAVLGVVTREVVDAADGWPAAEGGVGAVHVVP